MTRSGAIQRLETTSRGSVATLQLYLRETGRGYDVRVFAGDQDRDRAAATLREHYVRGRLTVEELSARTARVLSARSRAEIRVALAGLPLLPDALTLGAYGRMFARGAMLAFFTAMYLLFSFILLLVFAGVLLFHGATTMTLVGFLVVWLVPTYLLTRLWRRKAI